MVGAAFGKASGGEFQPFVRLYEVLFPAQVALGIHPAETVLGTRLTLICG